MGVNSKFYYTQNIYLNYKSSLYRKNLKSEVENLKLNGLELKKPTFFRGAVYKKYLYFYFFLLLSPWKVLIISKSLVKKKKAYRNFFFKAKEIRPCSINLILTYFFLDSIRLGGGLVGSPLSCYAGIKPDIFSSIKFDVVSINSILR